MAGDGSRGTTNSDPRARRCGFGLAIIRPNAGDDFAYVGHSYGGLPGRQPVPRADATALLQALLTTKGNAIFFATT